MTITRENTYEDVPSGRLDAFRRHCLSFFSNIGRGTRLAFESLGFIPATVVLLILLYQYLASVGAGSTIPVLRLLVVPADYHGSPYGAVESAFAAYMLAFSIRTGRGI